MNQRVRFKLGFKRGYMRGAPSKVHARFASNVSRAFPSKAHAERSHVRCKPAEAPP